MKFFLLLQATVALAGASISGSPKPPSLVARQSSLADDIMKVDAAVKAADASVKSGDFTKLAGDFKTLLDALDAGTANAKKSPVLTQEQALALATPAQDLSKTTVMTLQDLSAKKADIVKAGLGAAVYQGLMEAETKAAAYITVLTSKIPPSLSTVAGGIVKPAQDQLAKTVADFKDAADSGAAAPAESTPPKKEDTAPPKKEDTAPTTMPAMVYAPAATSPPAMTTTPAAPPAVYAPPASKNTTSTKNTTTSTMSAPPESYTGAAAAPTYFIGPAALAAAAFAAVAAL